MERHVSVDEDEGFCDSDSTDKAPILAAKNTDNEIIQGDAKPEKRKKKSSHKKVSFQNDIDEIPNVDIKINQSVISFENNLVRLSPSNNNENSVLTNTSSTSANARENEDNFTQKKNKGKSKGEKPKRQEKRSDQKQVGKSKKKRSSKTSSETTSK